MVKACKLESYSTKTVTIRRATGGGHLGHLRPPKFSKYCMAILTFVETFKE